MPKLETTSHKAEPLEVLWGADQIGEALGLSRAQANHLLVSGKITGARKMGAKWVITRSALRAVFEAAA